MSVTELNTARAASPFIDSFFAAFFEAQTIDATDTAAVETVLNTNFAEPKNVKALTRFKPLQAQMTALSGEDVTKQITTALAASGIEVGGKTGAEKIAALADLAIQQSKLLSAAPAKGEIKTSEADYQKQLQIAVDKARADEQKRLKNEYEPQLKTAKDELLQAQSKFLAVEQNGVYDAYLAKHGATLKHQKAALSLLKTTLSERGVELRKNDKGEFVPMQKDENGVYSSVWIDGKAPSVSDYLHHLAKESDLIAPVGTPITGTVPVVPPNGNNLGADKYTAPVNF